MAQCHGINVCICKKIPNRFYPFSPVRRIFYFQEETVVSECFDCNRRQIKFLPFFYVQIPAQQTGKASERELQHVIARGASCSTEAAWKTHRPRLPPLSKKRMLLTVILTKLFSQGTATTATTTQDEVIGGLNNKYELIRTIGRGAYGRVYEGVDVETKNVVAIKEISLIGVLEKDLTLVTGEVDLLSSFTARKCSAIH